MLSRLSMALVFLLVGLLAVGVGTRQAQASPVGCSAGQVPNPRTGKCIVVVEAPKGGGGTGGGSSGGGNSSGVNSGGGGGNKPEKCVFIDEVDCKTANGYWSNDKSCYIGSPTSNYARDDPIWEGNSSGGIYGCYNPFIGGNRYYDFWAENAPEAPLAPPDPLVLAQQAVAAMNLQAIQIGIVPEPAPGRIGVIGLPTWMWAENPAANTMGPITRSASLRGYTVTATAKVKKVVWTMGDGTTVSCKGPGTPYQDKYGKKSSPTCGHTYTHQGRYTVAATSYWEVAWAGIGQSGTIPLSLSNSAAITMGEAQVITR